MERGTRWRLINLHRGGPVRLQALDICDGLFPATLFLQVKHLPTVRVSRAAFPVTKGLALRVLGNGHLLRRRSLS